MAAHVDRQRDEDLEEHHPHQHREQAEGDERRVGERRPRRWPGSRLGRVLRLGNPEPDDGGVRERGRRVAEEEQIPAAGGEEAAQRTAHGEAEIDCPVEEAVRAHAILRRHQVGDGRRDRRPVEITEQPEQKRRDRDVQRRASEPRLPLPDLPAGTAPLPVEAHLARRARPLAVAGVVENGMVRLLDPQTARPAQVERQQRHDEPAEAVDERAGPENPVGAWQSGEHGGAG